MASLEMIFCCQPKTRIGRYCNCFHDARSYTISFYSDLPRRALICSPKSLHLKWYSRSVAEKHRSDIFRRGLGIPDWSLRAFFTREAVALTLSYSDQEDFSWIRQ